MKNFLFIGFLLIFGYSYTQTGTITDSRDGTVYKTVVIGNQTWMAENLNVDRFRNGDLIPEAKTNEEWETRKEKKAAWCYYNNDTKNGSKYGKLYNWHAVNDNRGLAPEGWHIPSPDEWEMLFSFLGGDSIAGDKIRSVFCTNKIRRIFRANIVLYGGYRCEYSGTFKGKDYGNYWWSSTDFNPFPAYCQLGIVGSKTRCKPSIGVSKNYGMSVLCIKD
jgi:uncharacterized protein (TIGR02145 family)